MALESNPTIASNFIPGMVDVLIFNIINAVPNGNVTDQQIFRFSGIVSHALLKEASVIRKDTSDDELADAAMRLDYFITQIGKQAPWGEFFVSTDFQPRIIELLKNVRNALP